MTEGVSGKIHVVLASDANYLPGLEVTKATMLASCSAPSRLAFHVFDEHALDCLSASTKSRLPLWNGSLMPYLRLWLPQLLPTVDRVVYSDVDTVWNRDVCELWDQTSVRRPHPSIFWVRDMASMRESAGEWIERASAGEGVSFDWSRYACSGICVMNLRKMRDTDFTERVLELYEKYGVPKFPDQDVLNLLFNQDGELLPPVWGAMGDPGNLPASGERCVYHLTGCGRHFHDAVPPVYPPQYQFWWNVRTGARNVHWRSRLLSKMLGTIRLGQFFGKLFPRQTLERVVRQCFFARVLVENAVVRTA